MKLQAAFGFRVASALAACALPSAASAAEQAIFLNAPAMAASPAPKLAVQLELKVRLPEGRGLARLLLDAGVSQEDAKTAARLAAGHLGAGSGGCFATISIERSSQPGIFSVMRVQLTTDTRQTVIERRGTELTVASDTPASHYSRLV